MPRILHEAWASQCSANSQVTIISIILPLVNFAFQEAEQPVVPTVAFYACAPLPWHLPPCPVSLIYSPSICKTFLWASCEEREFPKGALQTPLLPQLYFSHSDRYLGQWLSPPPTCKEPQTSLLCSRPQCPAQCLAQKGPPGEFWASRR